MSFPVPKTIQTFLLFILAIRLYCPDNFLHARNVYSSDLYWFEPTSQFASSKLQYVDTALTMGLKLAAVRG